MAQNPPVEDIRDRPHHHNGKRDSQPEIQPDVFVVCETDAYKGAQHHEIALGKVHSLGGLVNQYEPQSDQPVDTAIGEPADDQL